MSMSANPAAATRSFYQRPLPASCLAYTTPEGRLRLVESLQSAPENHVYFNLAAQFRTQDEPAFCGLSTLVMVLNSFNIDPQRTWKGPWRWFHESFLDCCASLEVVKEKGVSLDSFGCIASCNGLQANVRRDWELDALRDHVRTACAAGSPVVVASYDRSVLGQTGSGHFSPIGAYHEASDSVLVLDVARFKYPPHWIPLPLLHEATCGLDPTTAKPRGFVSLRPRRQTNTLLTLDVRDQQAPLVPIAPQLVSVTRAWYARGEDERTSRGLVRDLLTAVAAWPGGSLVRSIDSLAPDPAGLVTEGGAVAAACCGGPAGYAALTCGLANHPLVELLGLKCLPVAPNGGGGCGGGSPSPSSSTTTSGSSDGSCSSGGGGCSNLGDDHAAGDATATHTDSLLEGCECEVDDPLVPAEWRHTLALLVFAADTVAFELRALADADRAAGCGGAVPANLDDVLTLFELRDHVPDQVRHELENLQQQACSLNLLRYSNETRAC